MAATVRRISSYPVGPHRVEIVEVTHTGVTTSTITANDHGMTNIISVQANNETTAPATMLVQKNKNSGGAALGSVYTTAVTSGDVVTYTIMGN